MWMNILNYMLHRIIKHFDIFKKHLSLSFSLFFWNFLSPLHPTKKIQKKKKKKRRSPD